MPKSISSIAGPAIPRFASASSKVRARPLRASQRSEVPEMKYLTQVNSFKKKLVSQSRQLLLTNSNRKALAYTMSMEILTSLRGLPVGVFSRISSFLPSSSINMSAESPTQNPATFSSQSASSLPSPAVPVTLNQDSLATQSSVLSGMFVKAASVSTYMWNRSISSETDSTKKSTEGSSDENNMKSLNVASNIKKEEGPVDWSVDPDFKPFLQDMTTGWKNVQARARYLVTKLNSIADEENISKMKYLEDLYHHLDQYRDSRATAVECGVVKTLLKMAKNEQNDTCMINCARETLAVLGCNPAVKGHGIKVLSIDGGGVRGLVAIEVLRMMEQHTGKKVHELFDYICGVSTGSILAFLIGAHRRTLNECESLYKQLSKEIFTQNSILGAGNLFWSHSYYNTSAWEKILKKHIGEQKLLTLARDPDLPRVAAISTLVNQERVSPYVFRTYSFKPEVRSRYLGDSRYEMWEAVRASAAAPTYFEEIKLGNNLHQDGGVLVNNPTSVALSEAKTIWGGVPLQCVVSLGTGQTFSSRKNPNLSDALSPANPKSPNSLSWKGKFLKVLDSATDTESVHHTLTELLPPDVYFRFNPYLSEMVTMDEAKAERLERLQEETREYLIRNVEKVTNCCQTLTQPKGVVRKVYDWWSFYA